MAAKTGFRQLSKWLPTIKGDSLKFEWDFQVTEETIRRDLEKLEDEGFLTRTYGGAVLNTAMLTENIHFISALHRFMKRSSLLHARHYPLSTIKPPWQPIPVVP